MTLPIERHLDDPLDGSRSAPHSIDAEMCLLASMMLDRDVAEQVLPIVDGDSFFISDHRIMFEVMKELLLNDRAIDAIILRDELAKRNTLDDVGGTAYLARVLGMVPSAAHGPAYAKIVREKMMLRELIGVGNRAIQRSYESIEPAETIIDSVAGDIFKLAERRIVNPVTHLGRIAEEVYDMLEDKGRKGVETGFWDLDDMLNGLQDGEMIIVAARPSMGKTAFAMNCIQQISQQMIPTAVFSLEMSSQQLAQRMLCSLSGVSQDKVRKGQLSNAEYQDLAKTVLQLKKLPVYVDDSPQLTILDFRTKARRLKHDRDIKCIMIDYMQLMDNPGPESRQQQISEISRGIKAVARELRVPIIALSQLNRASESREGHRPRMSDLRESGSIEQDADVVMLLHREDYYHLSEPNYIPTGIAEVIIAKQRNGPTGTVDLIFDGRVASFRNKAPGEGVM